MSLPPLKLTHVVVGALTAAALLAASHRGGLWGRHEPALPHPPTPAAIAFERGMAEAATRRAAAERQSAALATATQPDETPEMLPAGEGRDDAFYRCTACHSTAVIRRSALLRGQWDELMDWMTEKHAMPPLEGADRELIVDYLAGAFPPRSGRGGRNPFATD